MPPTNEGLCLCGCGEKTAIVKQSNVKRGLVKGAYRKYVHGHNAKGDGHHDWNGGVRIANGYRFLRMTDGSYIQEHVLIATKALGRDLPDGAVVHHVNEDKQINVGSNLVICQDEAYHQYLHRRIRALRACGHANWMLCQYCKQYDEPDRMKLVIRKEGRHQRAWHQQCRALSRRELSKRRAQCGN